MRNERSITKQCAKCPWKVSTNPHEIPGGYNAERHRQLTNTIARGDAIEQLQLKQLRLMACHNSPVGAERPCIGWLHHQLNEGNNVALRMAVYVQKKYPADYELDGEQHTCLEDTLPKDDE